MQHARRLKFTQNVASSFRSGCVTVQWLASRVAHNRPWTASTEFAWLGRMNVLADAGASRMHLRKSSRGSGVVMVRTQKCNSPPKGKSTDFQPGHQIPNSPGSTTVRLARVRARGGRRIDATPIGWLGQMRPGCCPPTPTLSRFRSSCLLLQSGKPSVVFLEEA